MRKDFVMFDRREKNIEVFENSVNMMKNNLKLKKAVAGFCLHAKGVFGSRCNCNSRESEFKL